MGAPFFRALRLDASVFLCFMNVYFLVIEKNFLRRVLILWGDKIFNIIPVGLSTQALDVMLQRFQCFRFFRRWLMAIFEEEFDSFTHKSSAFCVNPRLPIFGFCYFMRYRFIKVLNS